jgi:hypothetical protein
MSDYRNLSRNSYRITFQIHLLKVNLRNHIFVQVRLPQEFVFRDVKFGEPMTLSFDIENRGQVQAGFEFQVPEMDQHHINSWLHIDPLQGVIPKSES